MAKNFPYFKFVATEWLTGDIVFEDYELQGLFINICALYWHRDGKITIDETIKRFKNNRIEALKDNFFNVDENGFISISFLDEQLIDANHISKMNSDKGKKSAEKRKAVKEQLNNSSTVVEQQLKTDEPNSTNKNKNKNKIKENIIPAFDEFLKYAIEKKPNVIQTDLKFKYDSWVANDWKNGNDKKITNWKTALLNTLPYIKEGLNNNVSLTDREEFMRNAGRM